MTDRPIAIYGAGGMAREVAWLAETAGRVPVCLVTDNAAEAGQVLNGVPVLGLDEARARHPGAEMVVAVGNPGLRERLAGRAAAAGFAFGTLVDPDVRRSRWVEMGEGTVVCAESVLTTNIVMGRHVQVNLDCTVAHDVVMEDYATLAPGVHVSGWVRVERGAYLGTGAVVINGTSDAPLVIGAGAVVGAGACVIRSVPPGTTVVGVPARAR